MNENNQEKLKTGKRANGTVVEMTNIISAGSANALPRWDGLADETGPIPAFGPVQTNEAGQIVMSDEERVARAAAAIRALSAIGEITDETDTDEVWAEFFRGLSGTS